MLKLVSFGLNHNLRHCKGVSAFGFGPTGSPVATVLSRIYLRVIFLSPKAKKMIMIFNIIQKKAHCLTQFSRSVVIFNNISVIKLIVAER